VAQLSAEEIQQLLDAGIIATRPKDAGTPAATASRSDGRERGPHFDPDYRQHVRDFIRPIAAAPGSDD
jgi:hypothetical protein